MRIDTILRTAGALVVLGLLKHASACPDGSCSHDQLPPRFPVSPPPTGPGGGPGAGPETTVTVNVFNFEFSINSSGGPVVDATINAGDTVHFLWESGFHSVTSVFGSPLTFDSGLHSTPFSFDQQFMLPGVYTYYCILHGLDNNDGTASGMAGTVTVVAPSASTWSQDVDGSWSDPARWTGGVPNAVGASATFPAINGVARTVQVDSPQTVGTLVFAGMAGWTLAGTSTLTIDNGTGIASISASGGTHTITAPLHMASSVTVHAADLTTDLSVAQLSAGPNVFFTKTGFGTLRVPAFDVFDTQVNGGIMQVRQSAGTSRTEALQVSAGGRLDLTNNAMVVDYTGASPAGTIRTYASAAYNGGSWNGNGLTSSAAQAAAGSATPTALGIAEATDLFTTFPAIFQGQQVDSTSILIRYTLAGDATLDLTVNGGDFNLLATNFGTSGKRWSQGDFTYDSNVNSADFNVLAGNFGKTLSGPGASVPEPMLTGAAMLLTLSMTFLSRGTRRGG